jgi:hypothetical protein
MGVELALRQGTHSADSRAQRFSVASDSLREIRAEMPTMDDEWEVEAVVQYRTYCLIKWMGYGERGPRHARGAGAPLR